MKSLKALVAVVSLLAAFIGFLPAAAAAEKITVNFKRTPSLWWATGSNMISHLDPKCRVWGRQKETPKHRLGV